MIRETEAWLQPPTAIYIHIPFCRQKCSYCDFTSFAGYDRQMFHAYTQALLREIEEAGYWHQQKYKSSGIQSVYFGGGTPSCLGADLLSDVMRTLKTRFILLPQAEVSIEVNPGTVQGSTLQTYREAGFNRLSIGLQSASDKLLRKLGRVHNAADFKATVNKAQQAKFINISADLMFGLPEQTMSDIDQTLSFLEGLPMTHISYYGLILEDGTPLAEACRLNPAMLPDDETERRQYHQIRESLQRRGLLPYEISSSAKPDFQCQHHLTYWQALPYYGFGLAAHSYVAGVRRSNPEQLQRYLEVFEQPATNAGQQPLPVFRAASVQETIDRDEAMKETMLLGLRLTAGVERQWFLYRFGEDMMTVFGREIEQLVRQELLILDQTHVALTEKGLDLANQAFQMFV